MDIYASLVDTYALAKVRILQPCQQSAGRNRLAFFNWQLGNAALHLETHQALMRFDIAGKHDLVGGRGFGLTMRTPVEAATNRNSKQNQNRD
jgi:hypothetical protein